MFLTYTCALLHACDRPTHPALWLAGTVELLTEIMTFAYHFNHGL